MPPRAVHELADPGNRNDEASRDPGMRPTAYRIVFFDRLWHRELRRGKEAGVVDQLLQECASDAHDRAWFGRAGDKSSARGRGTTIRQVPWMSTMTAAREHPLADIDWAYLEFYVGNAKQAAHYYCSAFGFDQVAYAGPETGVRDRASYYLTQNQLRFVLTSSLRPDDAISEHVRLHGDGIKDVAILVARRARCS